MRYKGIDVVNGREAMDRYLAFMKGQHSKEEEQVMFDALDKYCYQDTLAMVKLIDVLYEKLGVLNCNTTA